MTGVRRPSSGAEATSGRSWDSSSSGSVAFEGGQAIRGCVNLPGDKSLSHRALLFAGVSDGRCAIDGLSTGEDVDSTARFLAQYGINVDDVTGRSGSPDNATRRACRSVVVDGVGWDGRREPSDVVDCGNSGTTVRLGMGWLASSPFLSILTGDASLRHRPMRRVIEPLSQMGMVFDGRNRINNLPIVVRGGGIEGVDFRSPVASAQVKSAVLLAGLQAGGVTEVIEPQLSRDHTERMLAALGMPIDISGTTVSVRAGNIPAFAFSVPADPSTAAFWIVAATICRGSEIELPNVAINPTRTGFLRVLVRMGAQVVVEPTTDALGEDVGTITARFSPLEGVEVAADEIPGLIDEVPILAVAAAHATGRTTFRGVAELRVKESDRLAAISEHMSAFGATAIIEGDDLMIVPGPLVSAVVDSFGDHRMALAAAVMGLSLSGRTTVQNFAASSVSYPTFTADLEEVLC